MGDNMSDEEKIKEIINKLRPFLVSDGGDVEFVKYEDGVVYIKMLGACAGCTLIDYTLKDGIESAIREEVPNIKKVENIS
jgi:Fe-S cluster biogenesis protein NfuA